MGRILLSITSVCFAVTFFFFGRDLILATKVLFGCTAMSLVISLIFWKKVTKSDFGIFIATLVFSGLTLYFDNASFIKWRPTVINFVIAVVLFGLFFFKKAPFEFLFGKSLELKLPREVWLRVNIIWGIYMLFCAALNAFLVLMNYPDHIWVTFKTIITPILSFFFMLGLFGYLFMQNKKLSLINQKETHQ